MVCEGAAKGQAFREGASWVNKRLEKRLSFIHGCESFQALNFLPTPEMQFERLPVILRYRYVEQGSYQFGWYRGKQHSVP